MCSQDVIARVMQQFVFDLVLFYFLCSFVMYVVIFAGSSRQLHGHPKISRQLHGHPI